jgi:hypothetical protein
VRTWRFHVLADFKHLKPCVDFGFSYMQAVSWYSFQAASNSPQLLAPLLTLDILLLHFSTVARSEFHLIWTRSSQHKAGQRESQAGSLCYGLLLISASIFYFSIFFLHNSVPWRLRPKWL